MNIFHIQKLIRSILEDNEPTGVLLSDFTKFFPDNDLWREVFDYLRDQKAVCQDPKTLRWHLAVEGND